MPVLSTRDRYSLIVVEKVKYVQALHYLFYVSLSKVNEIFMFCSLSRGKCACSATAGQLGD